MIYALPSHLFGAAATISSSGAAVSTGYSLADLHDQRPTQAVLFDAGTATRIVWDWTSPVTLEGLFIIMHSVLAGTVVKVQANATNVWTAPSVSQDVTVLPSYDNLPANIFADLRGTTLASVGYRYTSILLPAQAPAHALGTLFWVGVWQQMERAAVGRVSFSDVRRSVTNMTSFNVRHTVEKGVRQQRLQMTFKPSDADLLKFRQLRRDARGDRWAWPIIIHPSRMLVTEGGFSDGFSDGFSTGTSSRVSNIENEDQFFVTLHPSIAEEQIEGWLEVNVGELTLDVLELQKGLPL